MPLPDRWPVRWSVLCRDLIQQLPPEALSALRVSFNAGGATSVESFFALTSRSDTWARGEAVKELAELLEPWARIEAVHALRALFDLRVCGP